MHQDRLKIETYVYTPSLLNKNPLSGDSCFKNKYRMESIRTLRRRVPGCFTCQEKRYLNFLSIPSNIISFSLIWFPLYSYATKPHVRKIVSDRSRTSGMRSATIGLRSIPMDKSAGWIPIKCRCSGSFPRKLASPNTS